MMVKLPFRKKLKGYFIIDGKPTRFLTFLIALGLIVIIFPDVIFNKATLSMLDTANISLKPRPYGFYHPEKPGQLPYYGYFDAGGAAFQQEPHQQFMKYVIDTKQSPYWNPYTATGGMGPETLIDNKFSPFTLLVVVFGGSSVAFHFVLLSLYVLAIYFLIRVITIHFKMSMLAAITASVVYLLNGYSVANISSNVNQSYLYFPILLFTLCSFAARPNFWRFLAVIFANILVLLVTFMPTTTLVIISVYLIAFGFVFNQYPRWKSRIFAIGLQIVSLIVAFLLLGFVWLPILESVKTLKLFEMYGARIFNLANWQAFLLFFTPKHFWEAYNATPDKVWNYTRNVIFHFGIVASLIAAQVFSSKKNFKNWIIIICLGLFILFMGRIFAVPGLYQIFGAAPFLKNIGGQYLWIVVAITFSLLSAFGIESLESKRFKIPATFVYFILALSFVYLKFFFWPNATEYIPEANSITYQVFVNFNLAILGLFVILSLILFIHFHFRPKKTNFWKIAFIVLIFLELFYYMDTMRYKREDIFQNPPSYIQFLKENIADKRLVSYSWSFNPELGAAYQIPRIETQNYTFSWYQKFYERNFQTPHDRWTNFSMVLGQKDEPNIHEEILDMLSVKYIITDTTMDKYKNYFTTRNYPLVFQDGLRYIFENVDPMPRVNIVPVLKKDSLTPDVKNYSVQSVVFTEDDKLVKEAQTLGVSEDPNTATNIGKAEIVSYQNTKVVIHADLQKPGILAMMDNWHPNWKATANGREVYIGQINESFRGIALPAGEYTIEMKYQPKTLPLGLWAAGIVSLILIVLLFFRRLFDRFLSNLVESKLTQTTPTKLNDKVSFAVVLPMFNEEKNAQACVVGIDNFLKKVKQRTAIIAVNDGSQDKTLEILEKLTPKIPRLIIASHPKNKGYGAANITGAKLAYREKFDYVLFMDADLTQNVKYITPFITEMKKGTDYIKATRYNLGGSVKGVPWKRKVVSRVGNQLAKILFRLPLSDYTNGFRAVKTGLLAQISCRETGFSYLIEEIRKVSKIAKTYAEVPYVLTARVNNSESKFRYNPKVYYNYLKYLLKK